MMSMTNWFVEGFAALSTCFSFLAMRSFKQGGPEFECGLLIICKRKNKTKNRTRKLHLWKNLEDGHFRCKAIYLFGNTGFRQDLMWRKVSIPGTHMIPKRNNSVYAFFKSSYFSPCSCNSVSKIYLVTLKKSFLVNNLSLITFHKYCI